MKNLAPDNALLFSHSSGFEEIPVILRPLLSRHKIIDDRGNISKSFEELIRQLSNTLHDLQASAHRQISEPTVNGGILYIAVLRWNEDYKVVNFLEEKQPSKAQVEIAKLSQRELEVVHWISEGKDNNSISVIMNITVETVKKHVQKILKKLACENRTNVARLYLESYSRYEH